MPKMSTDDLERLDKRLTKVRSDQGTYRQFVQECAEICKPRAANITSKGTPGEKRGQMQFDGTPESALDIYATGFVEGVFPLGGTIFQLNPRFPDDEVKRWASLVEEDTHNVLHGSNLDTEAHEACVQFGYAGQAFTFVREHQNRPGIPHFSTRPIQEWTCIEDSYGEPRTVFREYEMSAIEIDQEWPDHGCEAVSEALDKDSQTPDKKFMVRHAIYPREHGRYGYFVPPQDMPFASVYWLNHGGREDRLLLEEGGFREFPGAVSRISKQAGEDTGRSPAMKAWGDMAQYNRMWRDLSRRSELENDPPWLVASRGLMSKPTRGPGKNIFFDPTDYTAMSGAPVQQLPPSGSSVLSMELLRKKEEILRKHFLVDVFLAMPTHGDMRVDQVLEIRAQALKQARDPLGRIIKEYLQPLITRVIGIRIRAGAIPPPPPSLAQNPIDIEWISPLILEARKATQELAIRKAYAWADERAGAGDMSVFDHLNIDRASRNLFEGFGLQAEVLNTEQVVRQIREARERMQAQEQQRQAAMEQVVAMKELAGTAKELGNGAA